jgi:ABC-type transporter Mla subunit MlaD
VKRAAFAALLLLVAAGFALAIGATDDDDSEGKTYEIVFDNAFGVVDGGDFKVAGVRAGTTSDLEVITGGRRPLAVVKVEVTEPGFADLRRDAHCDIRPQSFIGEYFVDCQPGSAGKRIPDGGRVPLAQTSSTIPLDLVNNIVRRPYVDRLRLIVGELGAGLAGRPEDLSAALRRAHPGLRETTQTLRVLGRQTRTIQRVVADADTVVGALARRRGDVSRFVREAGGTAAVAATRSGELAAAFDRLPRFLGELDPYMLRLGQLATAQQPVLRNLGGAAGDLDTFLTRLPAFAEAGRPAVAALGRTSVVGRRAVRETSDDLVELRKLAEEAPALAKPLRQLLESIDDRERAVEPDPRAAATDPPAPDRTHISGQGGFTGMEAIWDYFFWQGLSTNALDDIGHVLRLNVSVSPCSGYFNHREGQEAAFDQCKQWLGPSQPGINEPDPTAGATPAQASAAPAVPPAPATTAAPAAEPVLDYLLGP